jgi:uncharacterized protein (TIGR02145 family)
MVFKNATGTLALLLAAGAAISCHGGGAPTEPGSGSNIETGSVSDIGGHSYRTVKIGDQWWMAENLSTTRFNNGDFVPHATDDAEWTALTTPAYSWYNNDSVAYGSVYGALYNWYVTDAGSNGSRNICPTGWHVPTAAEWSTLTSSLGGLDIAGGKMKERGTSHWAAPNTGATNSSGFSGLPGGFRGHTQGAFDNLGLFGHWWSSTEGDAALAWGEGLFTSEAQANHSTSMKKNGFSLRCVKD